MSAQGKKFSNKDELANWLKLLRVDDDDAIEAADKLFAGGFNKPSRLLGITVEILVRAGIGDALAMELSNKLKDQQQLKDAQIGDLPHINVSDAVFVLYEMTEKGPDPIATAFAISSSVVMTAAHNVVTREFEDESNTEAMTDEQEISARKQDFCTSNLMIASLLHKDSKGIVTVEGKGISVSLARYHYFHNWAFLKVSEDAQLTQFIPVATSSDELRKRGTLEKMYIYHCPVKIFRESRKQTSVHAMPKEASVGTISEKSLSFQNGGFSGSCGGPYVFRNKVVAIHVASENDIVDFEMLDEYKEVGGRKRKKSPLEKTQEVTESCTSSHTSLVGTGIILQARSGIMKILSGEITM